MFDRKLKIRVWLGSVLLASSLALFGPLPGRGVAWAAAPPKCQPSATPTIQAGNLASVSPFQILASPLLQVFVAGTGTYQAHIVFEPIPAPPPAISDGCKEDSRFTVNGFVGALCVDGLIAIQLGLPLCSNNLPLLLATQPANISLEVHFGTQPSKPLLTLLSDTPLSYYPPTGPVQVRFLQFVGLTVIASH